MPLTPAHHPTSDAPSRQPLSAEQNTQVERSLALMALGQHKPITTWETGQGSVRKPRQVCALDGATWECETHVWAMQRLNAPSNAPFSPTAGDVSPADQPPAPITASNGYKRHGDDSESQDETDENETPDRATALRPNFRPAPNVPPGPTHD